MIKRNINKIHKGFDKKPVQLNKELILPLDYIEIEPLLNGFGKEMVLRWCYRGNIKEWWKIPVLSGNELNLKP